MLLHFNEKNKFRFVFSDLENIKKNLFEQLVLPLSLLGNFRSESLAQLLKNVHLSQS